MSCALSSDCPLTASGVVQFCYAESVFLEGDNQCGCFNWIGFVGDNCDEISPSVYVHRFTWSLIILCSLGNIVLSARTLFYNFILGSNPIKGVDPVMYAGLFLFLSAVSILVSYVFQLLLLFDPTRLQLTKTPDGTEFLTAAPNGIEFDALVFGGSFLYFGLLLFIDSWEKVKTGRSTLTSITSVNAKNVCTASKLLPFASVVVFLVAIIVLVIGRQILALFVFFAAVSFIVAIVLLIISFRFFRYIRSMSVSEDPTVGLTVRLVRNFVRVTSLGLLLISVLLLLVFTLPDKIFRENNLGDFNYVLFLSDISILLACFLTTYSIWYFNSVTEGVILTDGNKCCKLFFGRWDRMNNKLMPATQPQSSQIIPTKQDTFLIGSGKLQEKTFDAADL